MEKDIGVACRATIGDVTSGTGPNGMLAAFIDNYVYDISFVDWMKVGVPLSACCLAVG